MDYLRSSVLATLVYYDIFDFPLTLAEIYKYLINPARVSISNKPIEELTQEDIRRELNNLIKLNFLDSREGYYFMRGRNEICDVRIKRAKIAEEKWAKFLRVSKWIQAVPYIRGIFASGSMAMNNTDSDSDFDVFIITKLGRIYTARLLLLTLTSMLRARRRWFDLKAPDKLCFNHYVTEDHLYIEHRSLYNAQSYAHLKPMFLSKKLFENFFTANNWISKYLYNFKPVDDLQKRISSNKFLIGLASVFEVVLNTKLGDWTEILAKRYQQRRIKKNPKTYSSGGRIVFNDRELEFHPNSFEKYLISKYNQTISKLGILAPFPEEDSGLN